MKHYSNIFRPGKLGVKIAKNRIFYSPMGDNMANSDGSVSEQLIHYYAERAKGGVGTIIPGIVCVDFPRGKAIAQQLRLDQIKYINGWSRLADAVHRYGALLMPQLHHAGMSTDLLTTEGLEPVVLSENVNADQKELVGNRPKDKYVKSEKKVLTTEDIKKLEQKFITSAVYAKQAGCDGVVLHAGSHYLIGSFLLSGINQRTDEYGGSLENRLRFACNIIRGIRQACERDFSIGIRISAYWEDCEENRVAAKSYEEAGVDFIDATFPMIMTRQTQTIETSDYPEGARMELSRNLMGIVNIPILNTGNYKTPDFVDKALADGAADFIGLARPLICDPEWCNKAKAGKPDEIRICLSCCECGNNNQFNRGLRCALNPEMGHEYEKKLLPPVTRMKKVVIVGGGIAGMQAAITACKRGHKAVLLEKTDRLGGQMHLACVPPNKELIKKDIGWFAAECERVGVDVRLNTEANIDILKELKADHVIIATGSRPFTAPINGVENTVQAWDILSGKANVPKNSAVTIIGGGIVGCELAELLVENKNKVLILERLPKIAPDMFWMRRTEMLEEFDENGVTTVCDANIKTISNTNTIIYEKDGIETTAEADAVILCTGQKSIPSELPELLDEIGIPYDVIGDAVRPRRFISATFEGYCAGVNL